MRTFSSKIALTALGVLAMSWLSLLPIVAHADTVTISPPRFELFGNPGDVVTEKIKVSNDGDTDITYTVNVEDFTAEGDQGSITFIDPETTKDNFSLARWITFEPSQFTIPAGQEKIITYTIRIPKTGEPGGHYGSVLIRRSAGGTQPGSASVDSRVGSLILLRVSGATTEKLNLENFAPEDAFQQYGPITFNMRFKNEGNVHVAPTGTIVITNMFGRKVKEVPLTPTNVLPDANRIVQAKLDEKNLIGRYTASLVLSYGQTKQTLSGSTSFIVFPFWLMIVIVGIIITLYLLVAKRKAIKRLINNLTRE